MTQKEKVSIERLDEKVGNILDILKGEEGLCVRVTKIEADVNVAKGSVKATIYWAGCAGAIIGAIVAFVGGRI